MGRQRRAKDLFISCRQAAGHLPNRESSLAGLPYPKAPADREVGASPERCQALLSQCLCIFMYIYAYIPTYSCAFVFPPPMFKLDLVRSEEAALLHASRCQRRQWVLGVRGYKLFADRLSCEACGKQFRSRQTRSIHLHRQHGIHHDVGTR